MKKKLVTVFLAIVAALCLCFGLAACGEEEKFSISTLEQIPIGASQEKVESVLGKPSEGSGEDAKWAYYDSSLRSYVKKAENLEKKQEDAFWTGDFAEVDRLMREYDSLMQEIESKQFSCIEVTFSSEKRVTSVFLDKTYSIGASQEKQIESDEILCRGSADTILRIEKQYYTDYRASEDGVKVYIGMEKNDALKDAFTYATTFTDGSWYHALLNDWDIQDAQGTWTWTDGFGEHIANKPYNVIVNTKSIGRIDKDGVWSGGSGIEGDFAIPDGVTEIGYSAFAYSGLTSITIPDGVTEIGSWAFYGCSGLTIVTIGSGVTEIGDLAFQNCSGLESVIWNAEKCTTAGGSIFKGCTKLKTVTFGEAVKMIPAYAFEDCSGLTSITIPESVTSIGEHAFWDCSGLQSVIWNAENCTTAESSIFDGCTNLKTVTFGENVKTIPAYAFCGCDGLTSIEIPNGVTAIGSYAFYKCSGLTSIEIPDSVTEIGSYAFEDCSGLTSIVIPDGVTAIGDRAFRDCSGLTSVTIESGVIGSWAFSSCSRLTSVTIGSGVIGSWAFSSCSRLTSVTIGSGVTSIGYDAFLYCDELTSAEFKNPNGWSRSIDGGTPYEISSEDLRDPPNAANIIRKYWTYDWKREA